jgi:hypothetical protein
VAEGISEDELKKLAMHLLNKTKIQSYVWPKVVMHKFYAKLTKTYSAKDWVEHRKRKK